MIQNAFALLYTQAMTAIASYLYMLYEDLHRIGNATSSKLSNVRASRDVDTFERNDIVMVHSNGKGISLITEERLERERARYSGTYLWKIPAYFPISAGLALFADTRDNGAGQSPDHYLLCPRFDMPLIEYVSLLSKLALQLERVQRL